MVMGAVAFIVFVFGLGKLEIGFVRPRAGGGLLRDDIASGVRGDAVDSPGGGILCWAGGGVVVPGESANVEGGAVGRAERQVVARVAGSGEAENRSRRVLAVQTPVGEVNGQLPDSELLCGRHSACDGGPLGQ